MTATKELCSKDVAFAWMGREAEEAKRDGRKSVPGTVAKAVADASVCSTSEVEAFFASRGVKVR